MVRCQQKSLVKVSDNVYCIVLTPQKHRQADRSRHVEQQLKRSYELYLTLGTTRWSQ